MAERAAQEANSEHLVHAELFRCVEHVLVLHLGYKGLGFGPPVAHHDLIDEVHVIPDLVLDIGKPPVKPIPLRLVMLEISRAARSEAQHLGQERRRFMPSALETATEVRRFRRVDVVHPDGLFDAVDTDFEGIPIGDAGDLGWYSPLRKTIRPKHRPEPVDGEPVASDAIPIWYPSRSLVLDP